MIHGIICHAVIFEWKASEVVSLFLCIFVFYWHMLAHANSENILFKILPLVILLSFSAIVVFIQ